MIDGVKLAAVKVEDTSRTNLSHPAKEGLSDDELDAAAKQQEVDDYQAELKMRTLVDMYGNMKQGDYTELRVAMVCPVCPGQVRLYEANSSSPELIPISHGCLFGTVIIIRGWTAPMHAPMKAFYYLERICFTVIH